MAKRKKPLKQRLYTYEQLNKKLRNLPPKVHYVRLYGAVLAEVTARRAADLEPSSMGIIYRGKDIVYTDGVVRQGEGFPIAAVYRAADNASVYMLYGIGRKRNKSAMRRKIARWMRYAPAFTPMPAGERLYEGERRFYLVKDGAVTQAPDLPGVWLDPPPTHRNLRDWADGEHREFRSYENYPRRCRLFARRLQRELAEAFPVELNLIHHPEIIWRRFGYYGKGVGLSVKTPPTATQNGRCLDVQIRMYDDAEARRFHHVDGDYGIKNCHFYALERGKKWSDVMRWKCARDAINGIKEWIIGDIYIPGPG
jgi:hypothetical protein